MKIITIMTLVLLSASSTLAFDADKRQKFKTTITITYNAITLAKATELEKRVYGNHKESCDVEIDLEKVDETDHSDLMSLYSDALIWLSIETTVGTD